MFGFKFETAATPRDSITESLWQSQGKAIRIVVLVAYVGMTAAGQALHGVPGCAHSTASRHLHDGPCNDRVDHHGCHGSSDGQSDSHIQKPAQHGAIASVQGCSICQWLAKSQHRGIPLAHLPRHHAIFQIGPHPDSIPRAVIVSLESLPRAPPAFILL